MRNLRIGKRLAMGWMLLIVSCALHNDRGLGVHGTSNPDFTAWKAHGGRPATQDASVGSSPALASEDAEFLSLTQSHVAAREYWASETKLGLQAPNRAHDLRSYFDARGVRVDDRDAAERTELVGLSLVSLGRGGSFVAVPAGDVVDRGEGRVEIRREALGVVEWFENSRAGLEQGFTLAERPVAGDHELIVELSVAGSLASLSGDSVRLATAAGRPLEYGKLVVIDANDMTLAAHFEIPSGDRIRIVVDDRPATYPIVIDPLLTATFDAAVESNQASTEFGATVASAGDVNGDGYDDVIVGAGLFDLGQANEGAAFVFLGGPAGIGHGNPATAHAVLEGNQISAYFGVSVASAGDVNGDGYADIVVGSYLFDSGQTDEGVAFVFHGSAGGIASGGPAIAAGKVESDQTDARLGLSVASAGDVNGDGYDDVIVGAFTYDRPQLDEGAAFVLLGGAAGIGSRNPANAHARLESDQISAQLGFSVATAGDVNADGYSDLIVGAPYIDFLSTDEGVALVYLGSATGVASGNPASAHARFYGQASTRFGNGVASAGDVNGDGYGDIVIGAPFHSQGQANEGAAFVFHGSDLGFEGSTYLPNNADGYLESNQVDSRFGSSVASAGDVNGDGYGDVIVGAYAYDSIETNEGIAIVLQGSATGIGSLLSLVQYYQANAFFGYSVAPAGDVNGDGFDDVIVGAYLADAGQSDEGAAFVYHGGPVGFRTDDPTSGGISVELGTFDVTLLFGTLSVYVAPAGDVNGDGFGDAIIGIPLYDGAQLDSGAVFVVHGSPTGLILAPTEVSAATQIFGDQAGSLFGSWVSAAGDVNGDGYDDVIVAGRDHDAGEVDEGAAFVFLGSPTGIASGTPGSAHARLETNQASAWVSHVAAAGDVNGDGYGDVLVSSDLYDAGTIDEGATFVFLGSSAGISSGNPSTAHTRFETDQALAFVRASSAGDLNGDGFGDVVVHSPFFDSGQTDEGTAFVLLGSTTGIPNGNPATAHARIETNQANAGQNFHAFSPGDVNGDGYADLLVSVSEYSNGESQEGAVFLFNGSGSGLANGNPTTADTRIESNQAQGRLGAPLYAPSLDFDVNADGFADLLFPTGGSNGPFVNYFFLGSAAGIPNGDLSSASSIVANDFGRGGYIPGGDINGDGHGDVLEVWIQYRDIAYPFPVERVSVSSVLSERGGRPTLARQRRGDGSGILVSAGGDSLASQFVAELAVRSPRGREYGKLEVEYCPGVHAVFGAPSCSSSISPSWVDLGTNGIVLTRTISGLSQGASYRWRARALYATYHPTPPGASIDGVAGPWYRLEGRALATDIRTPVPEPTLIVALVVGGLLLAGIGKGRRQSGGRWSSSPLGERISRKRWPEPTREITIGYS